MSINCLFFLIEVIKLSEQEFMWYFLRVGVPVIALVTPVLRLNATIVKLNENFKSLQRNYDVHTTRLNSHGIRLDEHEKLLAVHEERISELNKRECKFDSYMKHKTCKEGE